MSEASRAPRIAFYSHDTVGLGHIRRNVALAAAVVDAWDAEVDVIVITGNPQAASLPLPPRTDLVTLPTIGKDEHGAYGSRTLGAPLADVIRIRSAIIAATLDAFVPDLFVVDKVPYGVQDELEPALRRLATRPTKVVLGLREVLDDPVTAVRDWRRQRCTEAITTSYDAVWVYGDRAVYDPVVEYGLPAEVARKISYTGYLSAGRFAGTSVAAAAPVVEPLPDQPYVLGLVGGGQDGFELASAFVTAPVPAGHASVMILGPFMPDEQRATVHRRAAANPAATVIDFSTDTLRWLDHAAAVVTMGGYNTVCEVLATDVPRLLVPRTRPRAEQHLRAMRLQNLGAVDVLALDEVAPGALADWFGRAITADRPSATTMIDITGLSRVPDLARTLLAGRVAEVHHAA